MGLTQLSHPGCEHGQQEPPVLKGRAWSQIMVPQPLVSPSPEQALGAAWGGWKCLRYCSVFVVLRHRHRGPGVSGGHQLSWPGMEWGWGLLPLPGVGLGGSCLSQGWDLGLLASPKSWVEGLLASSKSETGGCSHSQGWDWGLQPLPEVRLGASASPRGGTGGFCLSQR